MDDIDEAFADAIYPNLLGTGNWRLRLEAMKRARKARAALADAGFGIVARTEWINQKPAIPAAEGWYRVMHEGDSESVDGHTIYDFPDYEDWAYWTPAGPDELEDFEGGYKGSWRTMRDEEGDFIFAYCGPVEAPPAYKPRG